MVSINFVNMRSRRRYYTAGEKTGLSFYGFFFVKLYTTAISQEIYKKKFLVYIYLELSEGKPTNRAPNHSLDHAVVDFCGW